MPSPAVELQKITLMKLAAIRADGSVIVEDVLRVVDGDDKPARAAIRRRAVSVCSGFGSVAGDAVTCKVTGEWTCPAR